MRTEFTNIDIMENQQLEWKEIWHDEHLKWICGFSNAQGGTLVIGKNHRDNGSCISQCHQVSFLSARQMKNWY